MKLGPRLWKGKKGSHAIIQFFPIPTLDGSWPFGIVARKCEEMGFTGSLIFQRQSLSNGYCLIIIMNKVRSSCVVSLGTHVTQLVTVISFLIEETGCRRNSAMVCGREILGNRWFLVNRLQWLRPTLKKELIYQADLLMNRNRKNNHNTSAKRNDEGRLPVVGLTAVFLPGKEIAF